MATSNEQSPKAQRIALWVALGAYVVFLVLYLCGDIPFIHIREQSDKWGQFGDYVGGVINPVVGLITIWLLTASLKQSQVEMELTREAMKNAEVAQKLTAVALDKQIIVSEHTRDINNASTLYERCTVLIDAYLKSARSGVYDEKERPIIRERIKKLQQDRDVLGEILDAEIGRLFGKYPGHKVTQTPPKPPAK